jgi:hypothetical protein
MEILRRFVAGDVNWAQPLSIQSNCHARQRRLVADACLPSMSDRATLAELNADDSADGTTTGCASCNSPAEAFQIVYATDNASLMNYAMKYDCNQTAFQLRALQYYGLSSAQIQSRSTMLVNHLIGFLQGASGVSGGPGWSPAVNGAGQLNLAALTNTSGPIIELLSQIHH